MAEIAALEVKQQHGECAVAISTKSKCQCVGRAVAKTFEGLGLFHGRVLKFRDVKGGAVFKVGIYPFICLSIFQHACVCVSLKGVG